MLFAGDARTRPHFARDQFRTALCAKPKSAPEFKQLERISNNRRPLRGEVRHNPAQVDRVRHSQLVVVCEVRGFPRQHRASLPVAYVKGIGWDVSPFPTVGRELQTGAQQISVRIERHPPHRSVAATGRRVAPFKAGGHGLTVSSHVRLEKGFIARVTGRQRPRRSPSQGGPCGNRRGAGVAALPG